MTSGPRISCSFCVVEGGAPAYMTFWNGVLCNFVSLGVGWFVCGCGEVDVVDGGCVFFVLIGSKECVKEKKTLAVMSKKPTESGGAPLPACCRLIFEPDTLTFLVFGREQRSGNLCTVDSNN